MGSTVWGSGDIVNKVILGVFFRVPFFQNISKNGFIEFHIQYIVRKLVKGGTLCSNIHSLRSNLEKKIGKILKKCIFEKIANFEAKNEDEDEV